MNKKLLTTNKDEAVSPVIAVILMVAITVVLAAVLYVMVSGMMSDTTATPSGALSFGDGTVVGGGKDYTGGITALSKDIDFVDVSMTVVNGSASAASTGTDGALVSGTAVVAGNFQVTYSDTNGNNQLDAGDVISITGATSGCQFKLVYIPSGGEITKKVF